ncbi:hypothetical protein PRIPAC_84017 [Pristionchus pacificus]|uniref:Uncharacterized protein n=1 Tax=Pristionchus pacificus TaxID=54126 RepID=A0A2A6BDH2_PRIPA|nr:hypothetical protein PRIPAC_84017 [Pristionchus pacificus]|eukprot:PDM63891.1 hypothetical protein PRIPAC_53674 [Pristionchus pacificus]
MSPHILLLEFMQDSRKFLSLSSAPAELVIAKFRSCRYLKAYEHLKTRFGKPNIVVHELVNELSKMFQATDDLVSLRDTVDRIQAIITLIDGYEESTNESVLHLLTSKFNSNYGSK